MQSVQGQFNRLFNLSEYNCGQFGPGLMMSAFQIKYRSARQCLKPGLSGTYRLLAATLAAFCRTGLYEESASNY
jgi:hypothetical protein